MKVKRLVIKNIGLIADTTIELNKPLILFYGEIRQGKTTILNAIRWAFGGAYPDEIIRHGEKEASVLLEFEGGSINREWYRAKDGTTKAREIAFIRDGKPVKKPVDEIKKFLNPFLLDQDHLRKMGETERKQYFAQLFAVDTSKIDKELLACESEARDLRVKVKMYGEIDLAEIKTIDPGPIRLELETIRKKHQAMAETIHSENKTARERNSERERRIRIIQSDELSITELEIRLRDFKNEIQVNRSWLKDYPEKKENPIPNAPDTSALEDKISAAAANNVRAEQYQNNLKRAEQKKADEKAISDLENTQRDLKKKKIAKLAEISETCKIKGLAFDESGAFTYEGTSAGMLSGSQIMKLSEELSNLYPKDLGIGLIDRAESLGKSVFLLIDRAVEEEKTILATVVGEAPSKIPEEVGVWIVDRGELKHGS